MNYFDTKLKSNLHESLLGNPQNKKLKLCHKLVVRQKTKKILGIDSNLGSLVLEANLCSGPGFLVAISAHLFESR